MHILLRSIILSVIAFRGPGLFRSLLTYQCKLLSNFCYLQTYFTNMNLSFVDSNVGNHYFKVTHKIVYIVKMVISWHNAWTYTVTIVHSQTSIYISADIVHPSWNVCTGFATLVSCISYWISLHNWPFSNWRCD